MKKLTITLIAVLLFLVSCVPETTEDEIVQPNDEQTEQEILIVPSYQLSKENYRMILPFRPSEARGVIGRQVANRLDIDEMEAGLMRHSTEVFDPEKYYYEEGQYLTKDMVIDWIDELNPERPEMGSDPDEFRDNPRYLSHILEQNYLQKNDDNTVELVGVSIGLALKSVYRFQSEIGGPYYYEEIHLEDMLAQGEEIAQSILERVRQIEELRDVPIMIALFREEEHSSPVPGNFVAKTVVPAHDMMIGEWESINEKNVLFPSDEAQKNYIEDYEVISNFAEEISSFFPNYVGYVGKGFYVNEDLKKLTIDIPIEFYGSAEVIGFTQYIYGIANGMFSNRYDLEIKVKSSQKIESVLYREAGEEDLVVHIFQ